MANQIDSRDFILEIQNVLGSGGYGVVYLVEDRKNRRNAAMKVFEPGFDSFAEFETKLLRIITTCHGLFTYRNRACIVYELLKESNTVFQCLDGIEKLRLFKKTLHEIATTIDFLASISLVHGDIKPDNIMFRCNGTQLQAVLNDFGLSYSADNKNRQPHTMGYTAPELLFRRCNGLKTDIFSLGVTCVEFLTGKNPFRARSYEQSVIFMEMVLGYFFDFHSLATDHQFEARYQRHRQQNGYVQFGSRSLKSVLNFTAGIEERERMRLEYLIMLTQLEVARRVRAAILTKLFGRKNPLLTHIKYRERYHFSKVSRFLPNKDNYTCFHTLNKGDVIVSNRFECVVDKIIGYGKFGKMFSCHDRKSQQNFTIKVFQNSSLVEYFTETGLYVDFKKLQSHRILGIARVRGAMSFYNHPCIVFEEYEFDLEQYIYLDYPFGMNYLMCRNYIYQLAEALNFVHSPPLNVVIGNLRPSIIMMRKIGNGCYVPVITDFSLAFEERDDPRFRNECDGYQAPEVMFQYSPGCIMDVFSLGAISIELYTGKRAFEGRGIAEVVVNMEALLGDLTMYYGRFEYQEADAFINLLNQANERWPYKYPGSDPIEKLYGMYTEEDAIARPGDLALMKLTHKMLELRPHLRPTSYDIWNDPFFDNLRN
ncbi:unnamed protein product [Caenorhabditis bovis]|uniref:Protein kinase domain-containing protein n=1 Tax=Caenorhabditis bovis TaxID=2654633 RepID=A0A8S1EGL9_9PELO|nr:unnamed protein product [Caenorhabditis bovis]